MGGIWHNKSKYMYWFKKGRQVGFRYFPFNVLSFRRGWWLEESVHCCSKWTNGCNHCGEVQRQYVQGSGVALESIK